MKKFINAVWDFFVEWGEYRYQATKRRGFTSFMTY
jgi:hypothetical protein